MNKYIKSSINVGQFCVILHLIAFTVVWNVHIDFITSGCRNVVYIASTYPHEITLRGSSISKATGYGVKGWGSSCSKGGVDLSALRQEWLLSEHALGVLHRVCSTKCVKPLTSIHSRDEELTGPTDYKLYLRNTINQSIIQNTVSLNNRVLQYASFTATPSPKAVENGRDFCRTQQNLNSRG